MSFNAERNNLVFSPDLPVLQKHFTEDWWQESLFGGFLISIGVDC